MLGIFIALFGSYLNPVIKVSKHKIICARWEANEIFIEQANKQLGLDSKSLMTAEYCENFK
ncbi:hypothetical protein EV06_0810 [Prochlorococcus sp. MIT 0602]|nr:hypothetical protein EV06_0810 [Prochlorococcus sp. MIT 0602]KGG17222.1 hypothetical protein EV07_0658 [Prochlorococcus sp. MIT 0603]